MLIKIKKLDENAHLPYRASPSAAGYDLTSVSYSFGEGNVVTYHTGIALEIPEGYAGFLFPRSSIYKTGMSLANSIGVIDSDYRGELMLKYYVNDWETIYKKGERCGQLVILPIPQYEFSLVEELSDTGRGEGGFGSTGV